MKKYIVALLVIAGLVGFDQWTKALAVSNLMGQDPFVLLPGVFEFHYSENRGAAFGILQNQRLFFLILTVIILAFIVFAFIKIPSTKKFRPLQYLCVLIAAGAIGNMIDRFFMGYVVDFLYFSLIDFPIFNVADCYITCSAILLIILIAFYYKDEDLKEIWK